MKFFTRDWRERHDPDDWEPFRRYDSYLAAVRSKLPAALLELHEQYTLHDAIIQRIESKFESRHLGIVLDGWDEHLKNPIRYSLAFSGVVSFDEVFPSKPGGRSGLGDVNYWECEALSAGVEVRMLLDSGAEFRIVFEGFTFEHCSREV
jgi:hypothetical protein